MEGRLLPRSERRWPLYIRAFTFYPPFAVRSPSSLVPTGFLIPILLRKKDKHRGKILKSRTAFSLEISFLRRRCSRTRWCLSQIFQWSDSNLTPPPLYCLWLVTNSCHTSLWGTFQNCPFISMSVFITWAPQDLSPHCCHCNMPPGLSSFPMSS